MPTSAEPPAVAVRAALVVQAALRWWRKRKPIAWSLDEHLRQPSVNCTTPSEHELAHACAKLTAARRKRPRKEHGGRS